MANSYIALDEPAVVDKKLDTEQLTVGANTVERERMQIAGTGATDIAPVNATAGLKVDLGADNDVTITSGTVTLGAGSAAIGKLAANDGVDIGNVDVASVTGNVTVIQGTATNLKTQSESYQGGSAVGAANPLQVSLANTGSNGTAVLVTGTGGTFPITAAALPLPTGAATEATLSALSAKLPAALGGDGGLKVEAAGTYLPIKFIPELDGFMTGAVHTEEGGAALTSLQLIDNFISGSRGLVTEDNSAAIKTAVEIIDNIVSGSEAQVDVVAALPAGTNLLGRVNLDPQTGNGLSIFRSLDLDETEEEIKATAGAVYGYHFVNRTTSALYLKFYNDTAANVTVGTTTPVMTLELPANASDHIAGHISFPFGIGFSAAITAAVTTGFADNDTGAPAANAAIIHVWYK